MVDRGWGHAAVDFATLSEPANCREYVALHHRLGVDAGDRLLDVACGSGLALELAALRGATCAGIDASARLIAVARDRSPDADLRVGDMGALPWDDDTFDVATSFRGVWATTPGAVGEIHRVLRPGGRVGITVWGHIKASPGAWALAPLAMAAPAKVAGQAAMVSLGRPGAGEALLAAHGFEQIERTRDPVRPGVRRPRALRAGDHVHRAGVRSRRARRRDRRRRVRPTAQAAERVRAGLPLRAAIDVVGYLAVKPT